MMRPVLPAAEAHAKGEQLLEACKDESAGDALRLVKEGADVNVAGKDGRTTQRGLVVVRGDDPAKAMADLKQHRIVLGPADCDEKHAAARAVFAAHGIDLPPDCPTAGSCTKGAAAVIEAAAKGSPPTATVISSYAQPLLEGGQVG